MRTTGYAGAIAACVLGALLFPSVADAQRYHDEISVTFRVGNAHAARDRGNCGDFDQAIRELTAIWRSPDTVPAVAAKAGEAVRALHRLGCTRRTAAVPSEAAYAEVCAPFGAGYYWIPGTETCIKFSGRVRAEGRYISEPVPSGTSLPPLPSWAGQCGAMGANALPGSSKRCIILGPNGRYVTLDLAAPAPAPTPPPPPSAYALPELVGSIDAASAWGGPYLGVNAGGTFGASDSIGRLGGSIGIQAGYGYMFGPRLYAGVEAGVGTGNISGSDTGRRTTEVLTEGANFSLSGRVGVAVGDLLLHATGGFNVVETEYTRTRRSSIKSDGEWVVIPVVGVGIETKLAPNVGVGVRYTSELRPAVQYLEKHEVDAVRSDTIKAYLNYYPFASATPAPQRRPFSWTGFYIGGNAGAWGGTNEFGEPQGGSAGAQFGYGTTVGPAYFGVESGYNFQGVGWSRMMGGVTEQLTQNGLVAVRGRFGIVTPGALVYATGGVAFAHTEFSIHGTGFHDVDKKWQRGLTAGLGLEVPLTASLSAGLQYEFASFAGGEYFDGTVKVGPTDLHGMTFIVNYRLAPN